MFQSMAQFLSGPDIPKWPKCIKTYNSRWETDPLLKTWIARHPIEAGKVVCRFCQSVIRAHKNDLLEHTRTLKHQRNFMAHATPEDYNQFVMELNELRKDAQSITKKKFSSGGQQQSHGNGKTSNIPNDMKVDITSWTSSPIGTNNNSEGGLVEGAGGNENELWSDANDSYSAESPSDLVSVILEEQQETDSPTEIHSIESLSSCHNHNSNTALTPSFDTKLTQITPNESPLHLHQCEITEDTDPLAIPSPARLTMKQKPDALTVPVESIPFTSSDVINAMEDDFFSLPELVAMAKCALDKVSMKLNAQCTLEQINNSLHPPSIQSSHSKPNLTAIKKTLNVKRIGKRKGKRKKSSTDGNSIIKNEGGPFLMASL